VGTISREFPLVPTLQRGNDKPKFKKYKMTQQTKITNYLTIDVEEHFQVAAFDDIISSKDWNSHELPG